MYIYIYIYIHDIMYYTMIRLCPRRRLRLERLPRDRRPSRSAWPERVMRPGPSASAHHGRLLLLLLLLLIVVVVVVVVVVSLLLLLI